MTIGRTGNPSRPPRPGPSDLRRVLLGRRIRPPHTRRTSPAAPGRRLLDLLSGRRRRQPIRGLLLLRADGFLISTAVFSDVDPAPASVRRRDDASASALIHDGAENDKV